MDGRISVAGVSSGNVDYMTNEIRDVKKEPRRDVVPASCAVLRKLWIASRVCPTQA